MYDYKNQRTNAFCKTQSSNLLDEVGQIEYIFSDKSGTLTKNEMFLTNFAVKNNSFGIAGKDDIICD